MIDKFNRINVPIYIYILYKASFAKKCKTDPYTFNNILYYVQSYKQ